MELGESSWGDTRVHSQGFPLIVAFFESDEMEHYP